MSRYELFEFLHIVGAIAWVGSGIGLTVYARRLLKAKDHESLKTLNRQGQALGKVLFGPAFVLVLGFGIAMVVDHPLIGFGDLWILMGFAGIVLSGVSEMAVAAPAGKRFEAAIDDYGFGSPQAEKAASRMILGSTLDIVFLLVAVWAMVVRPTL